MFKFICALNVLIAGANAFVLYAQGGEILNIVALALAVFALTLFMSKG